MVPNLLDFISEDRDIVGYRHEEHPRSHCDGRCFTNYLRDSQIESPCGLFVVTHLQLITSGGLLEAVHLLVDKAGVFNHLRACRTSLALLPGELVYLLLQHLVGGRQLVVGGLRYPFLGYLVLQYPDITGRGTGYGPIRIGESRFGEFGSRYGPGKVLGGYLLLRLRYRGPRSRVGLRLGGLRFRLLLAGECLRGLGLGFLLTGQSGRSLRLSLRCPRGFLPRGSLATDRFEVVDRLVALVRGGLQFAVLRYELLQGRSEGLYLAAPLLGGRVGRRQGVRQLTRLGLGGSDHVLQCLLRVPQRPREVFDTVPHPGIEQIGIFDRIWHISSKW